LVLPLTRSVWVCLYYRCFFDISPYYYCSDDEIVILLKESVFFWFFFLFSEWLNYCDFEKSFYNVQYRINIRIKFLKNKVIWSISKIKFFYFLIENFMLTKCAYLCLFSILNIFWVVKFFVKMIKKLFSPIKFVFFKKTNGAPF
jgi:hypothetical protein